jgi:hypothetical protein
MSDIPKSDQDPAGPSSSNQTSSGQPPIRPKEASPEEALKACIKEHFKIEEAALVVVFDRWGKMHRLALDPNGSWQRTLTARSALALDGSWESTATDQGQKCCFHVPKNDGSGGTIPVDCHDLPGECG